MAFVLLFFPGSVWSVTFLVDRGKQCRGLVVHLPSLQSCFSPGKSSFEGDQGGAPVGMVKKNHEIFEGHWDLMNGIGPTKNMGFLLPRNSSLTQLQGSWSSCSFHGFRHGHPWPILVIINHKKNHVIYQVSEKVRCFFNPGKFRLRLLLPLKNAWLSRRNMCNLWLGCEDVLWR